MAKLVTVGSLFAGIGGLDLGLERAGFRVAWQVEIDEWCRKVLTKHWPEVPKYGDIRAVGAGSLGPVDVICGGFPCTDVSNAGKRAGIDGASSGLWREYARVISELRPKAVIIENVAALRVSGLGRVLRDLHACGYDAEWDCIPAAAVGAPHRRDRIFVIAYPPAQPRGSDGPGSGVAGIDGAEECVADSDGLGREVFRSGRVFDGQRQALRDHADRCRREVWPCERLGTEPGLGGIADGVYDGVDYVVDVWEGITPRAIPSVRGTDRARRLKGIGNAVVPQVAELVGQLVMAKLFSEEW